MSELNLSICVVLYRSEAVSKRFHSELMASLSGHNGWQVSYYDNSPTDVLRSHLTRDCAGAEVRYSHDPRNLGFSYANNRLILEARHGRILLLNPDIFGLSGITWSRIARIDTSHSVRVARLLNADGSFQDCVGETSSLRRAFMERKNYARIDQPTQVGMGIMAFLLADKSVFAHVGLLDCDYPLYGEDMDWCYRATRAGHPVIFDPGIELTHLGGASASARWQGNSVMQRKYSAERIFIDKHFSGVNWALMRGLNKLKRLKLSVRT